MKTFIFGIIFAMLISMNVKADLIISLAVKQSVATKETTLNNSTTNNVEVTKNAKGVETDRKEYSTNSNSSDVQYTNKGSYGVLVQGIPSDSLPVAIGVGYFQDNTGMVTLGVRFK